MCFAIFGLLCMVKSILLWLLKDATKKNEIVLIPLKDHCEDIEYLLRRRIIEKSFEKNTGTKMIICVDCGVDMETSRICKIMEKDYPTIKFCKPNQIEKLILDLFANT